MKQVWKIVVELMKGGEVINPELSSTMNEAKV